ncbi:MarR family winged helix-turn-helix transcriptional regulator [Sphingosinicella sp. CPCC 101087]|uniref:MarR family winged helix-turn-helix transcriptional regulator n=1 Tax=Sphingosinicella sp. CPCC 101087 TaxID=2497754 RepID=UPI00101D7E48|nr:MarR family transcriptional regulator [Sphingosinicella sp. CPCC 101087]
MASEQEEDFVRRQGPAFLAHLLRRLSDTLVDGCAEWHPEQGVSSAPRTSSTLLALDEKGSLSVTELSALLRQSHPLAIRWIKQLRELGLVTSEKDSTDGRRSLISLTAEGKATVARLRRVLAVVDRAMLELSEEAMPGLVEGLWRMEAGLRAKPFIERLRALDHATSSTNADEPGVYRR